MQQDLNNKGGDAAAIIELSQANMLGGVHVLPMETAHLPRKLVVPEGWQAVDIQPQKHRPINTRRCFARTRDLVNYGANYAPEGADCIEVFSVDRAGLGVIFDSDSPITTFRTETGASGEESNTLTTTGGAGLHAHWGVCLFRYSRQLEAWKDRVDNGPMDQITLAQFLRDNAEDLVESPDDDDAPSAPEIMRMIEKFRLTRNVTFTSDVELSSGQVDLQYQNRDQVASVRLYDHFYIGVPVYSTSDVISRLRVELQYRFEADRAKLALTLRIPRLEDAIDREFERQEEELQEGFPEHPGCRLAVWPETILHDGTAFVQANPPIKPTTFKRKSQ